MMRLAYVLIILCCSLTRFAFAKKQSDDCGTVRLDQGGKAFSKIPVYNQSKNSFGDDDICYAIVASELRDAYRHNIGDSLQQISSPYSIALNYKTNLNGRSVDALKYGFDRDSAQAIGPGSPRGAIILNNNMPVCDQKFLEKFVPIIGHSNLSMDMSVGGFAPMITQTLESYRASKHPKNRWESEFEAPEYFECRKELIPNLKDLLEVVDESLKPDANHLNIGKSFVHQICKDHEFVTLAPPPAMLSLNPKSSFSEKALRQQLNRNLESMIPTGIAYCHENLQAKGKCPASHTSVIIGRRRQRGRCEYLMRDSYGNKCPRQSRFECQSDGAIWISAKDLSDMASFVYWIPEGK